MNLSALLLTIDGLFPKKQRVSRFSDSAQVVFPVTNQSETQARIRLEGIDSRAQCHFEFCVPGEVAAQSRQVELSLAPDETVMVPIRIILPANRWLGLSRPVYRFTIRTTMPANAHTSRSVMGELVRPPLIDSWLLSLVSICLLVMGVAGYRLELFPSLPGPSPVETVRQIEAPDQPVSLDWALLPPENVPEDRPDDGDEAGQIAVQQEMTLEEIFQKVGSQHQLDWRLLAEVAYQESRMNPWAVGRDNDLGLMQIIPSTWVEWAPKVGVTDPFDPYSNVSVAAAYLVYVKHYARVRGHHEDYWMLVGYNWGPNNLDLLFAKKVALPQKQHRYAVNILRAFSTGARRWESSQIFQEALFQRPAFLGLTAEKPAQSSLSSSP